MKIKFQPLFETTQNNIEPPIVSSKIVPQWYKEIPKFFPGENKLRVLPNSPGLNTTVKKCMPFLEAMTAGYTVVLADDIIVELQKNGTPFIRWRTSTDLISSHSPEQFSGLAVGENYHNYIYKWNNPWVIHTPKDYSLWVTHPSNQFELPFTTFNGFVETDSYTLSIQFPFLLKKGFEGVIEKGTPVAQLIPIKRETWNSEILEYDKDYQPKAARQFFGTIVNSYKKHFWVKKSYL